jgi:single-strand DNA-binding protein
MSSISIQGLVATTPRHLITAEGLPITSFRLAEYDPSGQRDTTNWYTITAFRTLGINTAASISKGDRVVVVGELNIRDWDNGERSGTSVEVEATTLGHDLSFGVSTFSREQITPQHSCNCDKCDKRKV